MDIYELPTVSVCIPTYNSEKHLNDLLPMLIDQSFPPTDIIIVDSNSIDGTERIAKNYGCIFHSIGNEEYNHGLTRNKFVELSDNDILVLITDDVMPESNKWLYNLTLPLIENISVVACVGPQGSRSDIKFFVRDWLIVRKNATYQSIHQIDNSIFPVADNCNTAYRAEVLREIPFEKTSFGEDLIWSKRIKDKGWPIRFEKNAGVYHYHEKKIIYYINRSAHFQMVLYELFGIDLGSTFVKSVKCFYFTIIEYLISVKYTGIIPYLRWMPYAIRVSILRTLGCRKYFKSNINREKAVYRDG